MFGSRTKENPTASYQQAFDAQGSMPRMKRLRSVPNIVGALSEKLTLTARGNVQHYNYRGNFIYDAPPLYTNRDKSDGTRLGANCNSPVPTSTATVSSSAPNTGATTMSASGTTTSLPTPRI